MRLPHLPVWVWAGLGIILIAGFNLAVMLPTYTTTKESFCVTCHYEQMYSEFWRKSDVHPRMDCSQCHATGHELVPSIDIFPLKPRKAEVGFSAEADRINPNCRRCHEDLIQNEPAHHKYNPLKIEIPHQFHVELLDNSCISCHYNVYHDPKVPSTFRPPKEACFECHKREKTSCAKCHPKGAISLPRMAETSHSACNKCHRGFLDAESKIYNIDFSHRRHLPRAVTCNYCHSNSNKHGEIISDRAGCIGCHHKKTDSACATCHRIQDQFIKGVALIGVEGKSDPMAGEIGCNSCHENISRGHSPQEIKQSCLNCHGTGYDETLEQWQSEISERVRRAKRHLLVLRAKFRHFKTDVPGEIASKVRRAETMIELVKGDKSMGGHNFLFARELITKADDYLLEVKRWCERRLASR